MTLHFADLQSQTCLFERYDAPFSRPARGGSNVFRGDNVVCNFQENGRRAHEAIQGGDAVKAAVALDGVAGCPAYRSDRRSVCDG